MQKHIDAQRHRNSLGWVDILIEKPQLLSSTPQKENLSVFIVYSQTRSWSYYMQIKKEEGLLHIAEKGDRVS